MALNVLYIGGKNEVHNRDRVHWPRKRSGCSR